MQTHFKSLMIASSMALLLGSGLAQASEADRLNSETLAREYTRQTEQQVRTRSDETGLNGGNKVQAREQVRQRSQHASRTGTQTSARARDMSSAGSRFGSRPSGAQRPAGFSRSGMR